MHVQVKEPGSFVVKYIESEEGQKVRLEESNVDLSVMGFIIGHEPVELSSMEFVVEGADKGFLEDLGVLYDGKKLEQVEFTWKDDLTLLVDLSAAPLKLEVNEEDTFKEFVLQGKIIKGEPGDSILFHFGDAFLTGTKTGERITNLGVVNDKADPAPQKLTLI